MNLFPGKIIAIFLLFISSGVLASPDSTGIKIPTIIHFTNAEPDIDGTLKTFSLDTTLDDVQLFNPAIRYFYNDLGNFGSAADPKLFSLSNRIRTRTGNTTFELYKFSPEKVRFYKTNKAYSNLKY